MGAAASIDNQSLNNVDYQTLRSAGLNFASAHSALESKISMGKSVHSINDVSLFAIRQLSQNLRNQDDLERTRRKVLKSRSLPDTLNYHQYYDQKDEDEYFAVRDEFDQTDLDLIDDAEFVVSSSQVSQQATPVQTEKKKPKKPNLSLMVTSSGSFNNASEMKEASTPQLHFGEEQVKPPSPSSQARISPHGTLYMGNFKIKETGIFPDVDPLLTPNGEMIKNEFKSFEDEFSWDENTDSNKKSEDALPALGGKQDFVEIATLGSGASGVVAEAMHVPSLTIVALKMLPVYNQEKRQSVSRELGVLYQNLTEMRLIDESLNGDPRDNTSDESNSNRSSKCPNVLSLYNAFIDPKSGMINLVVEYMDGGSLEDLVKQGGCSDERVLADLCYQTLNGLAYLHRNKSIHRDIKPANILCSSSGLIKIADFGISKALDKSTGFANSFVGTVCYMSPERITGESYSFSCDIWSFGLTILAVAKGRFPIALTDNGDDDMTDVYAKGPTVIGGPQGYWAMMKAICDDQPPIAGKRFSEHFNAFIDKCLQKDPQNRYSPQDLMDHIFIAANTDKSLEVHRHGYDTSEPSLLMNRLTAVTIAKTASRDVQDDFRQDRGIDLPPLAGIEEEVGQEEKDIIYSIRMEHLDRLLDKLKSKICEQKGSNKAPETPTKFEDLKWASSPSIISTVHSKPFDFGSLNSSVESLDNLVLHKEQRDDPSHIQSNKVEYKSPERDFGDKMKSLDSSHSILKTGSSFRREDDRKLNATNATHNSSNRSVHFQVESETGHEKSFKKSFRKKNLAPLNLGVINDNDNDNELEEDASFCLDLPKTSSYFATSKTHSGGSQDKKSKGGKQVGIIAKKVDYNRMLPKLNKRGMVKWQNLARQLHLPLGIVLVAARDKLGRFVDLDADI